VSGVYRHGLAGCGLTAVKPAASRLNTLSVHDDMNLPAPTPRSPWPLDTPSGHALPGRLRGKNIALLSDTPSTPAVQAFTEALQALGARVAQVRPAQWQAGQVSQTAVMLGRLYDALVCEGLAPDLVADIGHGAGCPVFSGLATETQALQVLADLQALR
jgi:ornithine carbamoyltransferase